MIKKLRVKFITLSMLTLFVLLSVILTSVNVLNYYAVIAEATDTLSLLANNRGVFPDFDNNDKPRDMSPLLFRTVK